MLAIASPNTVLTLAAAVPMYVLRFAGQAAAKSPSREMAYMMSPLNVSEDATTTCAARFVCTAANVSLAAPCDHTKNSGATDPFSVNPVQVSALFASFEQVQY